MNKVTGAKNEMRKVPVIKNVILFVYCALLAVKIIDFLRIAIND